MVLYNEWDPYAAEWLGNLVAAGHLPRGTVDRRDVRDLCPVDLAGVRQFHAFAGIGGWPLALRMAGWPEGEPIWTGSCPCQPFSVAGRGGGFADERHLLARLVRPHPRVPPSGCLWRAGCEPCWTRVARRCFR